MKILHIALSLSSRCGGPTVTLTEMTRHQALAGLDVTVYSTNRDYPEGLLDVPVNTPLIIEGVKHYYFSARFSFLLFSMPMAVKLINTIEEFDVLHLHALYRFPTTFAALLCRHYNVPYVIEPHGSLDPFLHRQSAHNLLAKRVYEKLFDRPNLNAAAAIHFSSEKEKDAAGFLHLRAPAMVVPHGIDWHRFKNLPSKGKMRQRLGLKDEPVILFLGRINFKKGLDLLIQAFSRVAAANDHAILVIAGPDNDGYAAVVRKWIKQQNLSHRVYWQGMLYGRQVLQAYVDADVFVLPSYTENFGIAVVEAMACALPVVISDHVYISGQVSQAGAGLVVRLNSADIAHAVITTIKDPQLAAHMGSAGRKYAHDNYAYENIIGKITRMYETVKLPQTPQ